MEGRYAIVRDVPDTYPKCIRMNKFEEIDVELAKKQHRMYCETLTNLGLKVIKIPADERYPDCCFVEDTAIVVGNKAIISNMGAPSRAGEEKEVKELLAKYKKIFEITPPATIDGGDVLKIDKNIYIALSERTNEFAIQQMKNFLSKDSYKIIPVKIKGILHLKSVCNRIGNDYVLLAKGYFDDEILIQKKLLDKFETEQEYQQRIRNELLKSKELIEQQLNKNVDFLCWPGGGQNDATFKIAYAVGYRSTTKGVKLNQFGKDPKAVSRVAANSPVKLPIFQRWFDLLFLRFQINRGHGSLTSRIIGNVFKRIFLR